MSNRSEIHPENYRAIEELAEKFIEEMRWSPDADEHLQTVVICNVRTFAAKAQKLLEAREGRES